MTEDIEKLKEIIVNLESEKAGLLRINRVGYYERIIAIWGIVLAAENAVKISLAREPGRYNEALACFATIFTAEVQRITDIDLVAMTNGRILKMKGFDQATSTVIEQQFDLCRTLGRLFFGDIQYDAKCAKVGDDAVQNFIEQWKVLENDGLPPE